MSTSQPLPSGTVTFLFTDLEGSTRLWEAHPSLMETAVRRHDEILTGAIEANAGRVFKHTGDGLLAAFDSPVNAIAAAVAAQLGLAAEAWAPEFETGLRSRMGVHTGTARAEGGDYLGPALNRAARLMAAGHGGQILISSASQRLARDGLPDGVSLVDLGPQRLRDLTTPEEIFQVCHPGLAREFPPVRAVDSLPGNLPLQVTSFVGRDVQMRELADALGRSRLLTLTGVGGVGKTRLALQIAGEVHARYADGAWFAELAPVGEPDAVPHALARVLGAQEIPGRTITDTIVDVLRTRRSLVILDNCEHLLHAAGSLAERIVRACPEVTIIATSREPLAVDGEHVWPVTSLAVPPKDEEPSVESLTSVASVVLFEERARAARHDFALTADNAAAVAEIARRLDGVPLALELAAARVRSMAPSEIAARLDERFRLLRSGRRTAMERHQTLRATVEWSYGLLADDERTLFDRLSVFAGGFVLEAAEQVCAGDPIDEFDVADLVASLVEKSMLVIEDQPDGITRYLMLETIRQFGEERLVARDEANEVGRRHAEYYGALAARSYEGTRGPDEARWVQVLDQEFDNLRAAQAWAMANEDTTLALGIPADLHPFAIWRIRSEVYSWVFSALALPGAESDPRYGGACAAAAWDAGTRSDIETAETWAARAIEHIAPEDAPRLAEACFAAGIRAWAEGSDEATAYYERALAIGREKGDLPTEAYAAACLAMILTYHGDGEQGRAYAETATATAQAAGTPSIIAMSMYGMAETLQDVDPVRAEGILREAIARARGVRARFIVGVALVSLATVVARHGDPHEAAGLLLEAVEEWRRRGNRRQQWVTLANVVELFDRLGYTEETAVLLTACLTTESDSTLWGAQAERLNALRLRLKEQLGDRFEPAVLRGTEMSDDEAIDYARAELARAKKGSRTLIA